MVALPRTQLVLRLLAVVGLIGAVAWTFRGAGSAVLVPIAAASPPPAMAAVAEPEVGVLAEAQAAPSEAPANVADDLEALAGANPYIDMPVPGFKPAVVSIPLGSTRKRPILIAAHGSGDAPEPQCHVWREIVKNRGFVICPRGFEKKDVNGGFGFDGAVALRREVNAAIAELAKRFPGYVDDGPIVFTGFSVGAVLGVHVIAEDPKRFSRAVLIEGGTDRWSTEHVKEFSAGGGARVLFACGETLCPREARPAAKKLRSSGVEAKVVVAQEGHRYSPKMMDEVRRGFPWLVADDARWARDLPSSLG